MTFRLVDIILGGILCFLAGMCVMLWYIQLTEEEPEQPVVNVYITIQNEEPEEEVPKEEQEETLEKEPLYEDRAKKPYSYDDAVMLAKMAYGEACGIPDLNTSNGFKSHDYHVACTMWTVLNRVDAGWGSIQNVITAKNQFVGYRESNKVDPDILNLAFEILGDWSTGNDSLRTLPEEYLYFRGDGTYNHFRTQDGTKYDWSLPDPFI